MLARRVIPCLDIRNGRIVKGVRFQELRDAGDPVERAEIYAQQGADEIVILDVSATPEGRGAALDTVNQVRSVLPIPLTVGGGVRTLDDALRLLDAGADKVAVNSAAVERPELISELAARTGRQCVVLAIDATRSAQRPGQWKVVTRSGTNRTELDARDWATQGANLGAGEILLTSLDEDGVGGGYDLDLLRAVSSVVEVPVIASGGASTAAHMADALFAGAEAVLAASIFHDGVSTVESIKRELSALGQEVRL